MNKYMSTLHLGGRSVRTAVFADSALHARLILEYQFGIGSVVGSPIVAKNTHEGVVQIDELGFPSAPFKPPSPDQARILSLKKQKEIISNNLDKERARQKLAKAQKQLTKASRKPPPS